MSSVTGRRKEASSFPSQRNYTLQLDHEYEILWILTAFWRLVLTETMVIKSDESRTINKIDLHF